MRVEPYTVGSYLHVLKRGGRGMPIVRDEADKKRFVRSLFYLNDENFDNHWNRSSNSPHGSSQTTTKDTVGHSLTATTFNKRAPRKPLVKILCFILMPNHTHLLIKVTREDGLALFMQKLGQSMTNHYNEKYKSRGSIFQGSYKSRTISKDVYMRYLPAYILVKNAFELFPGGIEKAKSNFEEAWKFAVAYPYSSLGHYVLGKESQITDMEILAEMFRDVREFKNFSEDVIRGGKWEKSANPELADVSME